MNVIDARVGRRIEVRGTVQGVGFRPWVVRLARAVGVGGRVRNHGDGVTIEAFGSTEEVEAFLDELRGAPPPLADIRDLRCRGIDAEAIDAFVIDDSSLAGHRALSIPPDLATCPACGDEVADSRDRRHRYAFTNCTHCGPRFTIATGVPYDRPATTMAGFDMCPACEREYHDVEDRRFHAQPNGCPECGPRLSLLGPRGEVMESREPLGRAAELLRLGQIVAVKGLGGFHLACDASSPAAVDRLRRRKRRDAKPFAVMVGDLSGAHELATLEPAEIALLTAPERPIVLVRRRPDAPLAAAVAPDTDLLGLFLPYTPLHQLLLAEVGGPLVMTSANLSDEPICTGNEEALERLRGIADAFCVHDRSIASRCDDSVARVIGARPVLFRRSRGYVPRPVVLPRPVARPVLGCGAHLKNTFCIGDRELAYLGPHVGDLETVAAAEAYELAIERMQRLLQVRPEVVAHDMHPDYLSTRYALERAGATVIAVQHHHAHVAAAMAEHGIAGPVIGVAYDGTGYGTDGTAWGGEIAWARADRFERLATFRPLVLAGGDVAVRQVWRQALALLSGASGDDPRLGEHRSFARLPPRDVGVVLQMIDRRVNAPLARGVGRYFDAFGALILGAATARHEGEVAMALERVADPGDHGRYPYAIDRGPEPIEIDLRPTAREVTAELLAGVDPGIVAARFHDTLVAATAEMVRWAIDRVGSIPVVLTGGCFQNRRLTEGLLAALVGDVDVRTHEAVPPGDGGVALGQVLVADAVLRGRES